MTTWTDNLEVPHLDQNVAQPEIPENVAKDIFDTIFSGIYVTDFPSNADYTYIYIADPTQAQPWHNYVQKFTDIGFPLTDTRTVTFPTNKRPYLLFNDTDQTLQFKITGQVTPIDLATGETVYAYSDGADLIKFDFGTISTIVGLSDVPNYDNGKVLRSLASTTEWYDIATDLAAKLAHTGGIATDLELKDLGLTEQTVTSSSNTMTIDLANGNHIYYNAIETTTITITSTSHISSLFKLLMHDGATSAPSWPASVKWPANVEPTWTTGDDYVEFVMINSIWIMSVVSLDIRSV